LNISADSLLLFLGFWERASYGFLDAPDVYFELKLGYGFDWIGVSVLFSSEILGKFSL